MLLAGFTGQFSLGHAAFLGVGAYTQAVLTDAGWPFPLALACAGGAVGGGRRRRRPAGAAREGHLPGHRDAGLRLHRRRGVRALGERDRRQRRHARQGARRCSAGSSTPSESFYYLCLVLAVLATLGDPEPAALADRARLRRHPRLGDLGAEHGHPPGALQDAVVRDLGRAGRHRRRAVRAQAASSSRPTSSTSCSRSTCC